MSAPRFSLTVQFFGLFTHKHCAISCILSGVLHSVLSSVLSGLWLSTSSSHLILTAVSGSWRMMTLWPLHFWSSRYFKPAWLLTIFLSTIASINISEGGQFDVKSKIVLELLVSCQLAAKLLIRVLTVHCLQKQQRIWTETKSLWLIWQAVCFYWCCPSSSSRPPLSLGCQLPVSLPDIDIDMTISWFCWRCP